MSERPWVSHANLAYSSFQRCSTTRPPQLGLNLGNMDRKLPKRCFLLTYIPSTTASVRHFSMRTRQALLAGPSSLSAPLRSIPLT